MKVSVQNIVDEINKETATDVQIVNFRLEQPKCDDMRKVLKLEIYNVIRNVFKLGNYNYEKSASTTQLSTSHCKNSRYSIAMCLYGTTSLIFL